MGVTWTGGGFFIAMTGFTEGRQAEKALGSAADERRGSEKIATQD